MRRVLRVAAVVAVVGCSVLFFSVAGGGSATGTRQESWMTVGHPWPWYEMRMAQEVKPNGAFASSDHAGVIRNSPAWLLVVGTVVGVIAFRRLRPVVSSEVAPA